MVQHLALKVPEKADYRKNASSAIHILLLGLPMSHYSKLVKWFFILAHNEKSAHRQFAIELMGRLLSEMERKKPTAVRKFIFLFHEKKCSLKYFCLTIFKLFYRWLMENTIMDPFSRMDMVKTVIVKRMMFRMTLNKMMNFSLTKYVLVQIISF